MDRVTRYRGRVTAIGLNNGSQPVLRIVAALKCFKNRQMGTLSSIADLSLVTQLMNGRGLIFSASVGWSEPIGSYRARGWKKCNSQFRSMNPNLIFPNFPGC